MFEHQHFPDACDSCWKLYAEGRADSIAKLLEWVEENPDLFARKNMTFTVQEMLNRINDDNYYVLHGKPRKESMMKKNLKGSMCKHKRDEKSKDYCAECHVERAGY